MNAQNNTVPFVDLKAQYRTIKAGIDAAIQVVIDETAFVRGRFVAQFEKEFAVKYGVKHCISCANGTDAIFITLKMLGIGTGDEVITTAMSWIATSETISLCGAKPVFVDIEPDCYCIDPEKIEQKITKKTRAILPVHLYGQPAQMDAIKAICDRHGLFLVEDCAQAHFAEFNGQKVGTFGIAGTFSFYPGKNLGAYGDAGCIVTNDDTLATKARMYANHGSLKKHEHEIEGINSRMDGLQAAILSVKLPHIDEWNCKRREHAVRYSELLGNCAWVKIPAVRREATPIFHIYCVQVSNRDRVGKLLKEAGIETAVHYPTALPFLRAYHHQGHTVEDFKVVAKFQGRILSLPMFPELDETAIVRVAEELVRVCRPV